MGLIAVGGLQHETNTFAPTKADYQAFLQGGGWPSIQQGEAMFDAVAGANIPVQGAIVGVMAVEFFITRQGELLVNEMAPRTHNSGHYTLDACLTSQFEQQVRMVCELPFGDTRLLSPVVMVNMLGDLWHDSAPDWLALLQSPNTKLHLYGKHQARPGRKMGHYCTLADSLEEAMAEAVRIFQQLQ